MKAIVSFFKNPLVVAILGLLAVALVIWFVGPLIAIAGYEPLVGEVARLVLILIVVCVWGVIQFRRRLQEKRANDELAEGIVEQEDAPATEPEREDEVALLRERFSEAVGILKKSKRADGGVGLYSLPWYVIIGPPGAGKTTALRNSGLRFPLADRFGDEALRGVGGTRNCDWWFTDEAILLDTAGRYTTQDSDTEGDRTAWEGFLSLLKKNRRRRPLNGVFVAISLSDLLLQSQAERDGHISAIRQRIIELYDYFGVRFPIYVLLTKADLVAGFNEFFDGLGQAERAQVWGFTLPLEEGGEAADLGAQFQEEFDGLLRRLNDRVLERMEQERDPQRRALILEFPRQMALLRDVLGDFLTSVFQPNRYESPTLLRGAYFTSGTQEGTPIDRLLGSVSRSFGLGAQALAAGGGAGRSYFITDVLRRVVFAESDLAGANRKLERLLAWGQRGAYAAAALLLILLGGAWFFAYRANQSYVDDVGHQTTVAAEALGELQPSQLELVEVLPALNAAADIPGGFSARDEDAPWSFGLSQRDKLGGAAQSSYRRLLEDVLLPRLVLRLEEQVRAGQSDSDYLFEALKAYRMMGEGTHYDPEFAQAWIQLDWETSLSGQISAEDEERLESHLEALLEVPPGPAPIGLDGNLILESQRALRAAPLAERAYSRLKRRGIGTDQVPAFTIAKSAGRDAPFVFARKSGAPLTEGVPGFYTQAGYESVFLEGSQELAEQIAAESWVLESPDDAGTAAPLGEELEGEVLRLYLDDYGAQYTDLLADVAIVPINSMDQAVAVLKILSDPKSPLLLLLQGVAEETSFGADDEGEEEGEEEAGALDAAKDRLRDLIGSRVDYAANRATRGYASPVRAFAEEKFGDLREQVVAPEGGQPAFQGVLDILNELYVFLDSVRKNPNAARALMEGSGQLNALVGNLEREAGRQPPVVQGVLEEVASTTKNLSSGDVRKHLNAKWKSSGLPFCRQAISGRYPVAKGSKTDISLSDFGRFFGPGGIMDKFFEENLMELVDTARSNWQWRPGGGMAKGSPGALAQFQRAHRIKETFFGQGGATPSVNFDLTPVTMDANITSIVIDIEGQRVTYAHGPAIPTTVDWPGPGPRQVRVQLSPPAPGGSGVTESGAWGWFRLLDASKVTPAGIPEQFDVTFQAGDRSARFRLAANSAFNPFGSNLLRAFRCPGEL